MLDQLLASLPKSVIAFLALVVGFGIIIVLQPPVSVCDAQMAIFRDLEKSFLYADPASGDIQKMSPVKAGVEKCRADNSPGGCFELFEGLKKLSADVANISSQCAPAAAKDPQMIAWYFTSMKLMVLTAWGSKPPTSYITRNGWFDSSEITLFCSLKRQAERVYGKEGYEDWREKTLASMPGAENKSRTDLWPLTLFANTCETYR